LRLKAEVLRHRRTLFSGEPGKVVAAARNQRYLHLDHAIL